MFTWPHINNFSATESSDHSSLLITRLQLIHFSIMLNKALSGRNRAHPTEDWSSNAWRSRNLFSLQPNLEKYQRYILTEKHRFNNIISYHTNPNIYFVKILVQYAHLQYNMPISFIPITQNNRNVMKQYFFRKWHSTLTTKEFVWLLVNIYNISLTQF